MALSKTLSGARALFSLGTPGGKNTIMAYASGVSFGEEIAYEPVEVLDLLEVKEWVPTAYRTTISANIFRTIGDGPSEGSLKKVGVFPKQRDILIADDLTAHIQDRGGVGGKGTQKSIIKVEGVKLASYNISVTARGLVGQDVSMVSIRAKDEAELP